MNPESMTFLRAFFLSLVPSLMLMFIFVAVNAPYYSRLYGARFRRNIVHTLSLNTLAIVIGWLPLAYYWPRLAVIVFLPGACIFGAVACVGSRFIYPDIIPESLAKEILDHIRKEEKRDT